MLKTIFSFFMLAAGTAQAGPVDHNLKIDIFPGTGRLEAEDTVTLPAPATYYVFSLHQGLNPAAAGGTLETLTAEKAGAAYGINFSSDSAPMETYRLASPKAFRSFRLKYAGVIAHPLGEQAEEYSRSFSETPGIISADGCYLAGSSGWYPFTAGALVTFRLRTALPAPYDTVAGGDRVSRKTGDGTNRTVWDTRVPQDEITLTCGKYSEYSVKDGPRTYYVFLRSPDEALASKYLEADTKYIKMYSDLIGPYPYGKFALVENFWDTGYGLPSFTLLGPQVLRLPFILNSSYPHEILHNWWGNGVFVDYEKGNWSEGLTAYLADYLIAEYRGKGREYRMTTLQKYADYVSAGKDFPLTAFRSRHSSASEAVGYGKALMMFHMLRNLVGDDNFRKALRDFYATNKFKYASYADLRASFEKFTGAGRLKDFFAQWTERAGAPELELKDVKLGPGLEGYDLQFTLVQKQDGPAYALQVPASIYIKGLGQPRVKMLAMDSREETYTYTSPVRPERLEIDPDFDVFRKLDPGETPPTLSRLLGAKTPGLVLPPGGAAAPWRALAGAWTKDKENLPAVLSDTGTAPSGGAYWVLGSENRLAPGLEKDLEVYGARFSTDTVTIGNRRFPREGNTFVFAGLSAGLVISGSPDKLPLLAVKLPHYGKYSWLVFDRGMNSLAAGLWEISASPLARDLPGGGDVTPNPHPRTALAEPPSAFSKDRIKDTVEFLAALPGGRSPGSRGHEKAAAYIVSEFKKAGLKPFNGKDFTAEQNKPGLANVLGILPGVSKKEETVVLSAHYDHLPAANGAVYPGADDNASGVALLLELARYYGKHPAPRSIIFAAFDGEEAGLAGSRAFMTGLPAGAAEKMDAALNFDTVGRLGSGKVLVLGANSSDKWVHIFRGAGFVTGADYDLVKEDLDSSDQVSFIEKGVPAVQFFSGPKADYHKPTDTAEKIDAAGIVKQAEFAREIIDYLAGDSDFLTRPSGAAGAVKAAGPARKVSTGLVPDFTFEGKGVRAQDVTPGSPLAATAFRAGDVIIAVNGEPVDGLKAYSEALKKLSPGQKVGITFLSGGVESSAELQLSAR